MEDGEAIAILTNLLKRTDCTDEEKEALRLAIGSLSWFKLVESRIQGKKRRRDAED
jgi:hypothetical protein